MLLKKQKQSLEAKTFGNFSGEFMSQYSWAEETTNFLEQKAQKD